MSESKKFLGNDLCLDISEEGTDLITSSTGDLKLVTDETNLCQAIVTRLKTRMGELEELGHPMLGSRLYEFVGAANDASTRDRLKSEVIDALLEEPRILRTIRVDVNPVETTSNRVDILVSILPVEGEVPLNMVIPFYLEVA